MSLVHPALRARPYSTTRTARCCHYSRYSTFCDLAGVLPLDVRAAAAELPPIDSISMAPVLLGTGKGDRNEILLAEVDIPSQDVEAPRR